MDPYEHLLGSPFGADQPRRQEGDDSPHCDWCTLPVVLDDHGMISAHHDADGRQCVGAHGDDYH